MDQMKREWLYWERQACSCCNDLTSKKHKQFSKRAARRSMKTKLRRQLREE
ncbi:hypothetical protein KAR91_49995 [Candidatus Pacearchaeota archaeon]|nr:hypothetical protein [Candidatus Pacearchaeota archaeon]